MEIRFLKIVASALIISLVIQSVPSAALISSASDVNIPYPKAINDLKEAIVKGLGFQAEGFKVSGFDVRDALVGRSLAYEFDLEIDNKVLPFKLVEDVKKWEYVDLPIFQVQHPSKSVNSLVEKGKADNFAPVLAPFQLAGPMEIFVQDAEHMRLTLPHDVDAGRLKKVILAEGAVVTVKGAKSVSLRHAVDLPLPFNTSGSGFASGLLTLAEHLRHASIVKGSPLLSLRIVGPTSLASPSSSSSLSSNRLKLKRIAPGQVELSSPAKQPATETSAAALDIHKAPTLLTPSHFTTLWPLASMNGTNSNLLGFEKLLESVLGPKASKKGSFMLLKADVSAQTLLKIGFGLEKKIDKDDSFNLEAFPSWRTKPETVKMHFEVLAKIEGDKLVPERVSQVEPLEIEDTIAPNVLTGNITMSTLPNVLPPPSPFAL